MTLLLKSVQVGALAAALLISPLAFAQKADTSPAKRELINKVLKLQQPAIEQLTVGVLSRPVNDLAQKLMPAIRRLPEDKRESTAKSIDASLRKFMEDNSPALIEKGKQIQASTIGTTLDERFTEEELKQLVAWLESPVSKKFAEAAPELQAAYTKKLIDDNGKVLDDKFNALQANIAKQLGLDTPPAGAASGAKPAAKPTPAPTPAPAPKK
ncbi:hypothetical protein SAMN05216359_1097 [Roseateles sp. YR242]|uniref:DUF2059 domain-containing protein n=1 Tax=Roseateles sp. YR242 TaxID=1855305 RepID=UPI0008C0F825|nr:DUF2059 domain-containing protein [Roseateles sp. YR242]SEL42455.1 hypothetical protein SAMN05216359_1097 [Roseateles sp. YR242]